MAITLNLSSPGAAQVVLTPAYRKVTASMTTRLYRERRLTMQNVSLAKASGHRHPRLRPSWAIPMCVESGSYYPEVLPEGRL